MRVHRLFFSVSLGFLAFGCCPEPQKTFNKQEASSFQTAKTEIQSPANVSNEQKFHLVKYSTPPLAAGAVPHAIATADFNDDGSPDVVAGFSSGEKGILILHLGIPRSENLPDLPFSESGNSFEIPLRPELLATGDFDNDGNEDLAAASRGGNRIYWLKGNGKGELTFAQEVELPGTVTTLAAADINRHDNKINLIAGGTSSNGWHVVILEIKAGAIFGHPEIFDLPAEPIDLFAADFDQDYWIDLAITMKKELMIVYGRDRKSHQSSAPARIQNVSLPFQIRSAASGRFVSENIPALALLSESGKIHLLVPEKKSNGEKIKMKWHPRSLARDLWPNATTLIRARVTGSPLDDLVLINNQNSRLYVISSGKNEARYSLYTSLDSRAVAVLPVRINLDALHDLVILEKESGELLSVALTQPQATYNVNLSSDESDADLLDGVCDIDLGAAGNQCTLRAAMQQANANAGMDFIFLLNNIQTVAPLIPLPAITDPVQISSLGNPYAIISGANQLSPTHGLQIQAGSTAIANIVINEFAEGSADCAIEMDTNGNNVIGDAFIGTDNTGTTAVPNRYGICVVNSPDNFIYRCLISGNQVDGIRVTGANSTDLLVRESSIGTDVTKTQALGNGGMGINFVGSNAGDVKDSIISGNLGNGVLLNNGSVVTSKIGTDISATIPLGNGLLGISIVGSNNTIGEPGIAPHTYVNSNNSAGIAILGNANLVDAVYVGTNGTGTQLGNIQDGILVQNGDDNVVQNAIVAFNGADGIRIFGNGAERNAIADNVIHSNVGLGVDLGNDGVDTNDPGDGDTGPNGLQNYPVITSAIYEQGRVNVIGTLNSLPNTEFAMNVYWGPSCDPSGFGEGENTLGFPVDEETTDANGDLSFGTVLDAPIGTFVTAIATRMENDIPVESSEFSACIQVVGEEGPAECSLEPEEAVLELGQEISLKVTVVDGAGNPVPDISVRFVFDSSNENWVEHTTTDSLGEAFTSPLISIVPFELEVDASTPSLTCGINSLIIWVPFCGEDELLSDFFGAMTPIYQKLITQHPRLQKYRRHFAQLSKVMIADPDLISRTNDVVQKFKDPIEALAEKRIPVIDPADWQMLQDLIDVYSQKASPEHRTQLQQFQNELRKPDFQREIGFIVAQKPTMEVQQ